MFHCRITAVFRLVLPKGNSMLLCSGCLGTEPDRFHDEICEQTRDLAAHDPLWPKSPCRLVRGNYLSVGKIYNGF